MPDMVVEDGSGRANANSYCSIDDADTYHEKRLHTSDWDNANDDDREKALMWATMLLDALIEWNGYKYDEDQALEWPRGGCLDRAGYEVDVDEIPQFLIDATAEYARNLIARDWTAQADTKGYSYLRAGDLAMSISKYDRSGMLPDSVWRIVRFSGVKAAGQQRYTERV